MSRVLVFELWLYTCGIKSVLSHLPLSCECWLKMYRPFVSNLFLFMLSRRTEFSGHAFCHLTPVCWNSLPRTAAESFPLAVFKSRLKSCPFHVAHNSMQWGILELHWRYWSECRVGRQHSNSLHGAFGIISFQWAVILGPDYQKLIGPELIQFCTLCFSVRSHLFVECKVWR